MERDHQTTLPVVLITWCLSLGSISRALAESQVIGSNPAESKVIGSPQPIIAVAGDDVILPCSLKPPINAEDMTVEWSRSDLDPKYVHVYKGGRDTFRHQNPSYIKRTSLFKGELIKGNVSLKLSKVKLEDQGKYRCFSPTNSLVKEAVIQLIVVAVSEPKISILETNGTGVVLQCEAKSLYPDPQLEWREGPKDSEGRLLSADVTRIHREPDGHYTVRSSMTVQKTDTNMFTCRVQLMKHNLKREAEIHVPSSSFQLTERSSDSRPVFRVGVVVVVLVWVIVGAVFLYRCRQKKFTQRAGSNDEDPEREEHPRQNITHHSVPGGPREGEDRGLSSGPESNANLSSGAESNANSGRDSLGAERVELSTFRSDG